MRRLKTDDKNYKRLGVIKKKKCLMVYTFCKKEKAKINFHAMSVLEHEINLVNVIKKLMDYEKVRNELVNNFEIQSKPRRTLDESEDISMYISRLESQYDFEIN